MGTLLEDDREEEKVMAHYKKMKEARIWVLRVEDCKHLGTRLTLGRVIEKFCGEFNENSPNCTSACPLYKPRGDEG